MEEVPAKGITQADWDLAEGKPCKKCGRLSLRLPDGLCMGCYGNNQVEEADKAGKKSERRYFKKLVTQGIISISELRDGRVPGERRPDGRRKKD